MACALSDYFLLSQFHKFPHTFKNMRHIQHPGIALPDRVHSAVCESEPFVSQLEPGLSLIDSVSAAMHRLGVSSAVMRLSGGALGSFAYCMPALSKTDQHAVYFSDTYRVEGTVSLETASVTFGIKNGEPWLHCHAVWAEPGGRRHCGHLLPEQVTVVSAVQATGHGLKGAHFVVTPDAETNFSLFMPQHVADSHLSTHKSQVSLSPAAYALRLSPNIDVCIALEDFCKERGITAAIIAGGVGSTVGAVFEDGRTVEPFVTELLVRDGAIRPNKNGELAARIDIAMIDYKGGLSEGVLARGKNPVLVTFELVVQPLCASLNRANSA